MHAIVKKPLWDPFKVEKYRHSHVGMKNAQGVYYTKARETNLVHL